MAVVLSDIINDVRRALRCLDEFSSAKSTADGVSVRFRLPDYPVLDVDSLVCEVEDAVDADEYTVVASADYTVDATSGYFVFDTPPNEGLRIRWAWKWQSFEDEDLIHLINAGIRYVYPDIIPAPFSDTSITTDGSREYEVVGADRVVSVEVRVDEDSPYLWVSYWRTMETPNGRLLHFTTDVMDGAQLRVWYVGRPQPFSLTDRAEDLTADPVVDELLVLDQPLTEVTGLPERAQDPLVHFVVWQILARVWRRRALDDLHQNQKEESEVTMRDLASLEQNAKLIFELMMDRFSDDPIHGHLVL